MEKQFTTADVNTVSVNVAITETANWRQIITPFMQGNTLRGFFIPVADVKAIADMNKVEGMRGYFCLRDPKDFSSIRFILVPVDDQGNDILSRPTQSSDEEESTIYDLTSPCPAFCDTTSPLY